MQNLGSASPRLNGHLSLSIAGNLHLSQLNSCLYQKIHPGFHTRSCQNSGYPQNSHGPWSCHFEILPFQKETYLFHYQLQNGVHSFIR